LCPALSLRASTAVASAPSCSKYVTTSIYRRKEIVSK
jgi:hypothetical protein